MEKEDKKQNYIQPFNFDSDEKTNKKNILLNNTNQSNIQNINSALLLSFFIF